MYGGLVHARLARGPAAVAGKWIRNDETPRKRGFALVVLSVMPRSMNEIYHQEDPLGHCQQRSPHDHVGSDYSYAHHGRQDKNSRSCDRFRHSAALIPDAHIDFENSKGQ